MSDYSEQGAVPVEDAAVDDPPTVDEVLERQREEFPDQARTSTMQPDDVRDVGGVGGVTAEEAATLAAGGELTGERDDAPTIEGPNPA